jgi:hypothetical protein
MIKTTSIFNEDFGNITASELLRKVLNYRFTVIGVTEDDEETVLGFSNEKDMGVVFRQTISALNHPNFTEYKEIKIIRNSTGAMMIYTSDEG